MKSLVSNPSSKPLAKYHFWAYLIVLDDRRMFFQQNEDPDKI